jgi:hypothetical protein
MAIPTIHVTGKILLPSGLPLSVPGRLSWKLSEPGTAMDGATPQRVGPEGLTGIAPNGDVDFYIVPNELIQPSGTYYSVEITLGSTKWKEAWQFAASPGSLTVGAIPRLDAVNGVAVSIISLSPLFDEVHFSGPGSVFNLPHVPITGSLHLYRNGMRQLIGVDYSLSGLQITMLTALTDEEGLHGDCRYVLT